MRTVASDPRFEGERNPKSAKTRVTAVMATSWAPFPTITERSSELGGGRKTWVCASPVSLGTRLRFYQETCLPMNELPSPVLLDILAKIDGIVS